MFSSSLICSYIYGVYIAINSIQWIFLSYAVFLILELLSSFLHMLHLLRPSSQPWGKIMRLWTLKHSTHLVPTANPQGGNRFLVRYPHVFFGQLTVSFSSLRVGKHFRNWQNYLCLLLLNLYRNYTLTPGIFF